MKIENNSNFNSVTSFLDDHFYLEWRQYDSRDVDVWDEDVTRDLADVLQEAEVQILILEPGQLQVAVDVGAVRVPVP